MIPWWARVEILANTVDSWPPPNPAVETKKPAYFPASFPPAQSWPVESQKAWAEDEENNNFMNYQFERTFHWAGMLP